MCEGIKMLAGGLARLYILFIGLILVITKPKMYTAESGIVVLGTKPEITFEPKIQIKELAETIVQLFESRKKTIRELVKTPIVINSVITKAEDAKLIPKGEYTYENFINEGGFLKTQEIGEMVKIKVTMKEPKLAKFFADEIAKITVDLANSLLYYEISEDTIKIKLKEAKMKYDKSFEEYSKFVKNNQMLMLERELDMIKKQYNYYKDNISSIERYIWQAKSLKEQLQKGSVSSSGELANSLALLIFKASIFTGDSQLPVKFDISQSINEKLSASQLRAAVEDIDNIITILENRKKEFEKELEEKKFEKQIQELETKIVQEQNKERELIKNRDLSWEALVALERKKEEIAISKDIKENILVKIAYLSELPKTPIPGKRKTILVLSLIFGLTLGFILAGIKEVYINIKSQL